MASNYPITIPKITAVAIMRSWNNGLGLLR
jgi:hypothetical protein